MICNLGGFRRRSDIFEWKILLKVPANSNTRRQDFSIKRLLLRLNRDLDRVVRRIDGKSYDRFWFNHSHTIHLSDLSKLQLAVLYLEDRSFFRHRGVELRAPARLVKRKILGQRAGGVSTLDQQLVRIATGRYERTFRRKIRETLLAFVLNAHRSKGEIFYTYLHDSYFGYRLEGCEITSNFIFGKPSAELDEAEASLVASLLARPLPKAVYLRIEEEKEIRQITPELVISLAELELLKWGSHIKWRYLYVKNAFPDIPNSLRMR